MAENTFTEFREMLRDFLDRAQLVDDIDPWGDTDYHQIVSGSYSDGDETKYLAVPISIWNEFYKKVHGLFGGRIGYNTLQSSISFGISRTKEFQGILDEHHELIAQDIQSHYETVLEALVPLSNISMTVNEQIQLGTTYLYPGGQVSSLYKQVRLSDKPTYLPNVAERCCLRMTTSGDNNSRFEQIKQQVRDALAILRFVAGWDRDIEDQVYNPAEMVHLWGDNKHAVLYFSDSTLQQYRDAKRYSSSYAIGEHDLTYFHEKSGLDHVNFHFNRPESVISRRIIHAIQMYDNAIRSGQDWLAYYQYIVSIELAIPVSWKKQNKNDQFRERVEQTIRHGGNYIGPAEILQAEDEDVDAFWDRFVRHHTQELNDFYTERSKILHGRMFDIPDFEIAPNRLNRIRFIAYNVIRLVARLAIEFDWYSKQDAERWYKNPIPSPTVFGDTQ